MLVILFLKNKSKHIQNSSIELEEIWVYIHEILPMMNGIMNKFSGNFMMLDLRNLIYTEYPDK